MSFFKGDDGKKYNLFGSGGVKKTAYEEFNKQFLGEIPIFPEVGKFGDLKENQLLKLNLSMKYQKYIRG